MSKLPSLGPRGEGWLLGQVAIGALTALAGLAGPVLFGPARVAVAILGLLLIGSGGLLALKGAIDLGSNVTPLPAPRTDAYLVDTGAYSLVRHPIYGGLILGALGWGAATASPFAVFGGLVLAFFLDMKSRLEEGWLSRRYPDYEAYRARTRRLVPWVY